MPTLAPRKPKQVRVIVRQITRQSDHGSFTSEYTALFLPTTRFRRIERTWRHDGATARLILRVPLPAPTPEHPNHK
jgi:hypothetical protein